MTSWNKIYKTYLL